LAAQRGLLPYGGSAWCPYRERGFETSDEVGVGAPGGEAVPLAERLELSPLHPREIHPRARTSSPAGDHHGLAISSSPAARVGSRSRPFELAGGATRDELLPLPRTVVGRDGGRDAVFWGPPAFLERWGD